MGVLIAKKYPTSLFMKAADHTYVECGTGAKAWGCWGGKTGGTAFNSGTGSTKRADAIAGANERAGITCYLINGVCHQAANRILLPAKILVSAARGYGLSSAIFGAYGKTGFFPCHAPFDQATGVTGDLPECVPASPAAARAMVRPVMPLLEGEARHLRAIRQAYNKFEATDASPLDTMAFQTALFGKEVALRLGDDLGTAARGLRLAKEKVELTHHRLGDGLAHDGMGPAAFIKAFNQMTLDFQDDVATALKKGQYAKLMSMDRDERIVLADPQILRGLYGEQVVKEVYGDL